MARKKYSVEQIIIKLHEAEVLQGQGEKIDQARRFKELEKENGQLKILDY